MTRVCVKCGLTIKCAKDKRNGAWLNARATQYVKKCANKNHRHSIAADKSCTKEDESKNKSQFNLFCADQGCFAKLNPREKILTAQARSTIRCLHFLFCWSITTHLCVSILDNFPALEKFHQRNILTMQL